MKLLAFFIALIVVTSLFGESRASGIGGIYGQQQRNRDGRGKVIQSIEKEKTNIINNPKGSVESANHHHAKPKGNYKDMA
ncbi:hypothetical protein AAZX31_19G168200 [Glycine max]|uniref:Uncharacterized protein n=2 Tax=Glycine subgen. Soja TaxID=1462606 RepID=K7MZ20_SOYBN|nr:hypothetical protein GYH30_053459 [Glycine max]KAH1195246.1 hypothetical protein GmHk_19G055810 [Glycine max]KRG95998.1 hypothetical protein GLYMA_19G182700v4 [Glycine max]RZB48548.1 hypothetical protein D0Y65_051856 [Glycine soja]